MTLTTDTTRAKINRLRGDARWPLSIKTAVEIFRAGQAEPKYPFLTKLHEYTDEITHKVAGHTLTVKLRVDMESRLGDDDVTGWFTDESDGPYTVKNRRRDWASDYDYYHLSTIDRALVDGSDDEIFPKGMSRGMRADYVKAMIGERMSEDADRRYVGVIVDIDGIDAALWGIDTSGEGADTYLREVAAELLDEILSDTKRLAAHKAELETELAKVEHLLSGADLIG